MWSGNWGRGNLPPFFFTKENHMPYTKEGTGYQNTDTSKAAMPTSPSTIRADVMLTLRRSLEPLSVEAVAEDLSKPLVSVRPRLTELKNAGLIEDSGERGLSQYNKKIILWQLTYT
jgi:DNA-binding transcriptional ArsR family regulator